MKLKHLAKKKKKQYSPSVSVEFRKLSGSDMDEVAGMMRGLMCAIEGWGVIAGLTNERIAKGKVVLHFRTVHKAHYFKDCMEYYLDADILEHVKIRRRVYTN